MARRSLSTHSDDRAGIDDNHLASSDLDTDDHTHTHANTNTDANASAS